MLYRKILLISILIFLFIQTAFHYSELEIIKYLLYSLEISLIGLSLIVVIKGVRKLTVKLFYLVLFLVIVLITFILNGQNKVDDIFKIFGGITIFLSAFYWYSDKAPSTIEKWMVVLISILPFLVYIFDSLSGFKEGLNSMSIFSNSNNYIFFSLCCVWLMMLYKFPQKIIWGFLALSFAITSTLGAFLGFAVATAFYFRKRILNPRGFAFFGTLAIIGTILILYSDLYLFQRIRGTANVISTLLANYDLSDLSKVSFGEAMALSGSMDGSDVSFLFRIKLWSETIIYFFDQGFVNLLFGLGFGSIPGTNSFGLVAHNDYFTWLIESGFIGFTLIVSGIWVGFLKLKDTQYIIPYLAILIYFMSENLFYNFFALCIFSFCLASSIQQLRNENITN